MELLQHPGDVGIFIFLRNAGLLHARHDMGLGFDLTCVTLKLKVIFW